jgi:hypothetical protein
MEQKLFKKLQQITKKRKRPVEEIHRSFDVVEHVLQEANDLGVAAEVVTHALKYMKENPYVDISDAIIAGYDECLK